MAEQAKKSATTVVWSDTVSIENAQKKKQELLKAFNSSDVILLDISNLEDLDISAVQLILASEKEALMRKKKFKHYNMKSITYQKLLISHNLIY